MGHTWSYGDSRRGQLGRRTDTRVYCYKLGRVLCVNGVNHVAAGFNLSALVKSDGDLFTFG